MDKPLGDIKSRVSYKKKIASDYARQKAIMNLYDTWYGDFRNNEELEKYEINYGLFNGRLDVELYDDPICIEIEGKQVKFAHNSITHFPIMSQVCNAMYGEIISRAFNPMAKDFGAASQTLRDKKWNELIRELINTEVNIPLVNEVTQKFLAQAGIMDTKLLTPEQIEEMRAAITQTVEARTPESILDFMDNDFSTPTQKQAQLLLNYFVTHEDINYKQQQGFKHAIVTGNEFYYVGEENGDPVFRVVNPKFFNWGGSQNTEWVQDGTWAKYEEWLSVEEATQRFAEVLKKKDYKQLEPFIEPRGGYTHFGDPKRDIVQNRVTYMLSADKGTMERYDHVNYKTKAGQSDIVKLYEEVIGRLGQQYGTSYSNYGIRVVHIVWRDKTLKYKVTRLDPVTKKEKTHWFDEHYTIQEDKDIEVLEVWVDEVWEGWKLGSGSEAIFINIRPIPNHQKSIYNPFGAKLPYIGKAYNSHMGNAKNISIMDPAKSWQKEFDTTMAQLRHDLATDVGNVFVMSLSWKPDHIEWQQWFDILMNGKILLANFQKFGPGAIDPNAMRNITMSKAADIANKIQLLEYYRSQIVQAMNFNDYRIGAIGQYATNQNVQQAQTASYNQTEGYFETHRKIVEKALNLFMNKARILYRDNEKIKMILDDVSRMELELSPDFWYEEWVVEFTTSADEIRRVDELRQQMMAFVQNGMSFDGILALALARTPNDIIDIMKKENKRQENLRKEAQQLKQQEIQMQIDADAKDKQDERAHRERIEVAKMQSAERRAEVQSEWARKQADADLDNKSDVLEKAELETMIKKLIEDRKADLKDKEIELHHIEEMEKIGAQRSDSANNTKTEFKKIELQKIQVKSRPKAKN